MSKIEKLKEKIKRLYLAKDKDRADWADWLYKNHIFSVAREAAKLAKRYGANKELAMAAGMLHDIADTIMKRENPEHEQTTSKIAKKLLEESSFTDEEIEIIVNDAIRFHGCKGNERPQLLEGRVMAAADAIVHLRTDFYQHAVESSGKTKSWVLAKIDRDLNNKISFPDVRQEVRADYKRLRDRFSQ